VIQRCQVHKKRNVKAHVPEKHWPELERRLSGAFQETHYETAKRSLEGTATWLERINPDAAASLREGLEETLTVIKLGVPGVLRRSLATTNPIESALSVTRRVTARVTRWRDGDMRRRWCVAGLLRAESKFRRLKGHREIRALLKALEGIVHGQALDPRARTDPEVRKSCCPRETPEPARVAKSHFLFDFACLWVQHVLVGDQSPQKSSESSGMNPLDLIPSPGLPVNAHAVSTAVAGGWLCAPSSAIKGWCDETPRAPCPLCGGKPRGPGSHDASRRLDDARAFSRSACPE
jgi:hypothetical protein